MAGKLRFRRAAGLALVLGATAALVAAPARGSAGEEAAQAARREASLRRYLKDHPTDAAAYSALGGFLLFHDGKPAESLALLQAALRHRPAPALAAQVRNLIEYWQELQGRRESLPALLERAAESPIPVELVEIGQELVALGETEAARPILLRAASFGPAEYTVERAHELAKLLVVAGVPDEASELLRSVVARRPGDPDAHHALGEWLEERRREAEAMGQYRLAIDAEVARSGHPHSEALGRMARLLERQGDFAGALAARRQRLALPERGQVERDFDRATIGRLLSRLGRHREAVGVLRPLAERDPRTPFWWDALGHALLQADRAAEAGLAFERAVELAPLDTDYRYWLGISYGKQQRFDDATVTFRLARSLDPADADIAAELGRALIRKARLGEAERHLREAVALEPDRSFALFYLGRALEGQGKLPEAVACFRRVTALAPDHPTAYFMLASALGRQGRLEEAAAELLRGGGRYSVWAAHEASTAMGSWLDD